MVLRYDGVFSIAYGKKIWENYKIFKKSIVSTLNVFTVKFTILAIL